MSAASYVITAAADCTGKKCKTLEIYLCSHLWSKHKYIVLDLHFFLCMQWYPPYFSSIIFFPLLYMLCSSLVVHSELLLSGLHHGGCRMVIIRFLVLHSHLVKRGNKNYFHLVVVEGEKSKKINMEKFVLLPNVQY